MLTRALTTATVMLLIGGFAAVPVRAENLEAGKSPSQIFTGTCLACHKGMRGLVKTVAPGSLPGFLRQHYTTSAEMAGQLSAYLLSNGAVDVRSGSGLAKQGKDARYESRPEPKLESRPEPKLEPKPVLAPEQPEPRLGHRKRSPPREAEKPDLDRAATQAEHKREPKSEPAGHLPRNAKRLARPGAEPADVDRSTETQPGAPAAGEGSRPFSAKRKLGKRGRPRPEELPKDEATKTDASKAGTDRTSPAMEESPGGEGAKAETPQDGVGKANAKIGVGASEGGKGEATRGEARGSESTLRADPVPAVSPAPKPREGEAKPAQTPSSAGGSTASVSSGSAGGSDAPAAAAPTAGPAAQPVEPPSEPPTPPISR